MSATSNYKCRLSFYNLISFYRNLAHTTTEVVHQIIYINNRIITITRLDKVKNISKEEAESLLKRMIAFYGNLQVLTNGYLVKSQQFFFDLSRLLTFNFFLTGTCCELPIRTN